MASPSGFFHLAMQSCLSLFAPPRCRECRAPLFDHNFPFLCGECFDRLAWIGDGACPRCGYPAGPYARHRDHCGKCRGLRLHLGGAAAVGRYRNGIRSLVLSFKFRGETEMAAAMAGLMARRWTAVNPGQVDAVVPVVLHAKRKRARGFDQAALLARHVALELHVPDDPQAVRRIRYTQPQARLRRRDRLNNMDQAFTASEAVAGKRILLVDDVMTTGATMAACASACCQAGARRVYALVFAR